MKNLSFLMEFRYKRLNYHDIDMTYDSAKSNLLLDK